MSNNFRWYSADDSVRGHIAGYQGTCSDNRSRSDPDALNDERSHTNPHVHSKHSD
ncbi:hypothetical protein ACVWXL_001010 [Bradyrhizobium sp. GM22.5]